jgi:hypothetical protein
MKLILADGENSRSGEVTHYVPVKIKIGDHQESLAFDASTIGYDAILGLSWLKKHNPVIKWSDHTLSFPSAHCRQHCLKPMSSVEAPVVRAQAESFVTPSLFPSPTSGPQDQLGEEEIVQRNGSRKVLPPRNPSDVSRPKVPRKTPLVTISVNQKPPLVSLVGAEAFAKLLRPGKGNQLFTMTFEELASGASGALQSTLASNKITSLDLTTREFLAVQPGGDRIQDCTNAQVPKPIHDTIPPEYHEFGLVFSKQEANKLPSHRLYDHRIPLEEGTTLPYGPIYSLSPIELDTLRKYIDKNLQRGFIRLLQTGEVV